MTTSRREGRNSLQVADAPLGPPQGPRAPEQMAAAASPKDLRRACIVVVDAPDSGGILGRRLELGDGARIGSAFDNGIVLGIDGVEAHHARIERRATGYHLVVEMAGDRPARTWLGERLVQDEAALRHGDKVSLGRAGLEFFEGDTEEALDEAYHECIYRLTILDGTTGAYNERYLNEALSREMSRRERRMALAIFEVDGLGHLDPRGRDDALRAVARLLRGARRPDDVTARIGADELAVMMPDTSETVAREWVDAISATIREKGIHIETGPTEIASSVGIAVLDEADRKATDLMARARARREKARRE